MSLRVDSDRECCANCAYNDDLQCSKWKGHAPLRASELGEKPAWCPGWWHCMSTEPDPAMNPAGSVCIHESAHYQSRAVVNPYAELDRVLAMARAHAAEGKGKERHALPGQPFEQQVIVADSLALGSNHGNLLQIVKKAKESARLPKDRAIAELLGVINNAAAAVLVLERLEEQKERNR